MSTKPERRPPQLSNAEQETEAAAERLNSQIEAALASVATRNPDDAGELEAYADRIERSAPTSPSPCANWHDAEEILTMNDE